MLGLVCSLQGVGFPEDCKSHKGTLGETSKLAGVEHRPNTPRSGFCTTSISNQSSAIVSTPSVPLNHFFSVTSYNPLNNRFYGEAEVYLRKVQSLLSLQAECGL